LASSFDQYYYAALDWANNKRRAKGLPTLLSIPRGKRKTSSDCPLARAIKSSVSGADDYQVQKFIERFDAGRYPELVDKTAA
jgi:hypothetical protein